MNRVRELAERLDELSLTPLQKQIAHLLIEGRSAPQIAVIVDQPQPRIRLSVARIFWLLKRLQPPDAGVTADLPIRPPRGPQKAGAALKLPEHPGIRSRAWPNNPLNKRRAHQNARAP